jgi:hypothetical protein
VRKTLRAVLYETECRGLSKGHDGNAFSKRERPEDVRDGKVTVIPSLSLFSTCKTFGRAVLGGTALNRRYPHPRLRS